MSLVRKILTSLSCVALVIIAVFSFVRFSGDTPENTNEPPSGSKEIMGEPKEVDSDNIRKNEESSEQYVLLLEGEKLCAYRILGGGRELIKSHTVTPLLMSGEDMEGLTEGIYTDSYEDLCLYFESYSS